MPEFTTENAIISRTVLEPSDDHGIFSAWIMLEGDGWGCGFGGYALDGPVRVDGAFSHREDTTGLVGEFIRQVCYTVGVSSWEKLPGTHIRAISEGLGGGITAIGHFNKDRWFTPKEWFASRVDYDG